MIRLLRRWLLGVEPEGPPLLADPLYRYEARRHWTPGRYAVVAVLLVLWTALVAGWLWGQIGSLRDWREVAFLTMWLVLLCRVPLGFFASTGAALCIVPERVSGQIEQFVLTPVDSWRFCLARLAGRLKGLMVVGACVVPVAVIGALVVLLRLDEHAGRTGEPADATATVVVPLLVILLGQLDLAAMLVVDAAVGMRFTATSGNAPMALIRTYLANFVLTPVAMFTGAMAAGCVAVVVTQSSSFEDQYFWRMVAAAVGAVGCRMALGAWAIRLALRDARVAIHKTFYQPEDAG